LFFRDFPPRFDEEFFWSWNAPIFNDSFLSSIVWSCSASPFALAIYLAKAPLTFSLALSASRAIGFDRPFSVFFWRRIHSEVPALGRPQVLGFADNRFRSFAVFFFDAFSPLLLYSPPGVVFRFSTVPPVHLPFPVLGSSRLHEAGSVSPPDIFEVLSLCSSFPL